ncbi:MAG: hypothetical protein LBI53_01360 [Candidatus Peribacteria bacterium]|jgi:hypothetical protein|nr:hypothetical protein [Candidatus Peribacteria bacterium]
MANQPINDSTILTQETFEKGEKVNEAGSSKGDILEETKKEVVETIKDGKSDSKGKEKNVREKKGNIDQVKDNKKEKTDPKLEQKPEVKPGVKPQETDSNDTKKLTDALAKKETELTKFQKDFSEKVQEMGTNQKKLEG